MSEFSFDIVSKVETQELTNAITQALREIENRYDFKGSKSDIKQEKTDVIVSSDDEYKLNAVIDILQSKLIKRGISLKSLEYGKIEPASGGTVRQTIEVKQGIDKEVAKVINTMIRDSKLKVKSQVQGDQIRVSGKSKDDLQKAMTLCKDADLPIDLQFVNLR